MKLHDPEFSEQCYVIAEIGVNHNGSIELAKELIDAAVTAGADAVKFQTFFADELVSKSAATAPYQRRNTGSKESQYAMLKKLELRERDFEILLDYSRTAGIDFLSTPFGFEAAELLERIGVTGYKVSSGDLTYVQFLAHLARKGLPIVISTGMASIGEVEAAVDAIEGAGPVPLSILHCVSDYPADPRACNLRAMATLAAAFGHPVGWSDHTIGSTISIAAVALGARIIEKHITLSCDLDGPDHAASIEPSAFSDFVTAIREVEVALGSGVKRPTREEVQTAAVARRSIVARRRIKAGEVVRRDDVDVLRPGTGLAPSDLELVVGTKLGREVLAGSAITGDDLHHELGNDEGPA